MEEPFASLPKYPVPETPELPGRPRAWTVFVWGMGAALLICRATALVYCFLDLWGLFGMIILLPFGFCALVTFLLAGSLDRED